MRKTASSKQAWAWLSILFSSLCLLVLILFLGKQNFKQVIEQSYQLNFGQETWLWAMVSSSTVFLLRSIRLKLVLTKLSLTESLYVCATHNALTRTLPFRSGELSLPFMLNRHHQVPFMDGSLLMLWLRLIEIASILPFVGLCLALSPSLIKHVPHDQNTVVVIVAVLSLGLVIWIRPITRRFIHLIVMLFRLFKKDHLIHKLNQVEGIGKDLSYAKSAIAMAITFFILLGQASLFYWILHGCGASLTYVEVALASILVHLVGVLPAPTLGNVGTHEMAWTVIFKGFACSTSVALLSALISQWLTLFFAYLWWALTKLFLYITGEYQNQS